MVIETLYILYKAITTDLTQGNEDVKKSTKSVGTEVTAVDKQTQQLGKQFKKLAGEIAGVLGVAFTAGEFFRTLKDASDFGRSLGVTSNLLNINARELQAWGQVLEHVGGSAEGFQSDLQAIGNYFHVRAADAIQLLPLLAQSLSKLNPLQANMYGQGLGISLPMIKLLREGNDEIAKQLSLQVKLGLLTQQDADKFVALNDAVLDSKNALRSLGAAIVSDDIPGLNSILNGLTKLLVFLRENRADLEEGLTGALSGFLGFLAIINPEVGIFVAGILAIVAAFKAVQEIKKIDFSNIFPKFSLTNLNENLDNKSDKFLQSNNTGSLDKAITNFNSLVDSPIATQSPGSISNSSRTNTYNHNYNIGTVQTPDVKSFQSKVNSFSDRYNNRGDFQQANGAASSGVQ